MTKELKGKIIEIAQCAGAFGYSRIHDMLRLGDPGINHKRVYRVYSETSLRRACARKPVDRPRSAFR